MGYSKIWALHDARAHSPAFFLSPKRPRGSLRSPVLDLDPDARFSSVSFGFWIWAWGNSWPHHLKFLHFLLNMLCMMARYRSVGRRSRSMHERSTMVMSELVSWWASIVIIMVVIILWRFASPIPRRCPAQPWQRRRKRRRGLSWWSQQSRARTPPSSRVGTAPLGTLPAWRNHFPDQHKRSPVRWQYKFWFSFF